MHACHALGSGGAAVPERAIEEVGVSETRPVRLVRYERVLWQAADEALPEVRVGGGHRRALEL